MDQQWYAVRVRSRTEKKTQELLSELCVESYVPIRRELRQWSDRKKWVDAVLIHGYVFVKMELRYCTQVLRIPTVVSILREASGFVAIPEKQMEMMMLLTKSSPAPLEFFGEELPKGSAIQVMQGPLIGFEGEVIRYHGKRRLCVRFPSFGSLTVELDASWVQCKS